MRRLRPLLLAAPLLLLLAACDRQAATGPDPGLEADGETAASRGGPANSAASCDVTVPGDASTIQGGVDAASPGATVCVEAGTYTEQVVVNKDLALQGRDGAVIQAPADPDDFTIPESAGSTWEPIVFVHGGSASGGEVTGSGTVAVDVSGFTVEGGGRPGGGPRYVGIFYRNASGSVAGNTVRDMGVGGRETFGILAYGDSEVTIADNAVSGYERGGIGANGDGGAHPAPAVRIVDNDITGSGDGSQTAWGPNGIQVGFGASGRVAGNTVHTNRWSPSGPVASCILVFESDGVRIQGNEVSDCDTGIGVGSWGWFAPSADDVKIGRNTVDGASFGIYLSAVAFAGFTSADPSVSNVKVVNNRLAGGSLGAVGIAQAATDADPDFDPAIENNKLIRNRIVGFATAVRDDGTATKQQANVIEP